MEETTLQDRLEQLLHAYSRYFDIERDAAVPGGSYPAFAAYHFREENYIATRAHTLYATEQHEYVYFFLAERLDLPGLREQIDRSREAGLARVKPHGEHMATYVTLVILAQSIDPEAERFLRRYRFRKNFRLTLHGWMEYRIAAMDVSRRRFLSNPAGREACKNLARNFPTQAK